MHLRERVCERRQLRKRVVGFTLIEVIVVITLMTVLVATAMPRLMDRNTFSDISTVDQLRGGLRYAQRIAAARNRDVCVSVAGTGITFASSQQAGKAQPCTVLLIEASDGSSLDITLAAGNLPAGVTLTATPMFRFTPAGTLANAAGNAIGTRTISVVRKGVAIGVISVQPDNGYVL